MQLYIYRYSNKPLCSSPHMHVATMKSILQRDLNLWPCYNPTSPVCSSPPPSKCVVVPYRTPMELGFNPGQTRYCSNQLALVPIHAGGGEGGGDEQTIVLTSCPGFESRLGSEHTYKNKRKVALKPQPMPLALLYSSLMIPAFMWSFNQYLPLL